MGEFGGKPLCGVIAMVVPLGGEESRRERGGVNLYPLPNCNEVPATHGQGVVEVNGKKFNPHWCDVAEHHSSLELPAGVVASGVEVMVVHYVLPFGQLRQQTSLHH